MLSPALDSYFWLAQAIILRLSSYFFNAILTFDCHILRLFVLATGAPASPVGCGRTHDASARPPGKHDLRIGGEREFGALRERVREGASVPAAVEIV